MGITIEPDIITKVENLIPNLSEKISVWNDDWLSTDLRTYVRIRVGRMNR